MKKIMLIVALVIGLITNRGVQAIESYVPGDNFSYGCKVAGCDGFNNAIADNTEACSDGWKIVCGYNMDGEYEDGDFRGSCSCAKLANNEESSSSGFCGNCYEADDGTFKAGTDSCKNGLKAQCHDGQGSPGVIECSCTVAGIIEENAADNTSYQTRLLNATTITSTTHIYDPTCNGSGISTAFGCIPYDSGKFATKFLQVLFGIGGGIAFLLMVYGFILVATSSGDEKKLQAAKETITSAITGLLVSIFALLLFRLIAVNILKIPGISSDGTMSGVEVNSNSRGSTDTTVHTTTTTNDDGTTTETEHGGSGRGF